MLFRAALCTAIFVATTSTQAKDVKLGDVSLRLTAPSGFCELDDSSPAVEKLRMLLGQRNTLLASYADCESGPARTLDDFAIYTAPTSAINMRFPPDAIEKVCDRIRSQG